MLYGDDWLATQVQSLEDYLPTMKEGSTLWKVKGFNKWYRRRYVLDLDKQKLVYDGSHKVPCCVQPDFAIDIFDIQDVRKGWKTDVFNKMGSHVQKRSQSHPEKAPLVEEKSCFSVIYGNQHRSLDLVAPNENVCEAWVRGLNQLIAMTKSIAYKQNYDQWLKKQFRTADADNSGGLTFNECLNLLEQMNVGLSKRHAFKLFQVANTNQRKRGDDEVLDEEEFVTFYKSLQTRPELEELMKKYCIPKSEVMGPAEVRQFLHLEQKMFDLSIEECEDKILAYEPGGPGQGPRQPIMTLDGFRLMLLSENHDIFNPKHRIVYQDMTHPLSHYYIASSHNTYLIADQLAGDSSVEGYIRALKKGCRCVELDCWDGPDNEPVIYHGYTLTSKILFKDVLVDAIKPYAFQASEYPLILSMENHCSVEQQKVMASHLKTVLGETLYTEKISNDLEELPSPSELKGKIILKAKKLPDQVKEASAELESESEDEVVDYIEKDNEIVKKPKATKVNIAKELSDLVVICRAVHFHNFAYSLEHEKCYHMSSFSEKKALRLSEESGSSFVDYNKRQLSRIYPAGSRTASSNYDPFPSWNAGCQIVALNYQTACKEIYYNDAKFRQNGSCGYVLKPEFLRTGSFNPMSLMDDRPTKILQVKVISGQHLPKHAEAGDTEIVDPYVIVKIRGHPTDKQKVKTSMKRNNGFNPEWNETVTLTLKLPELALVYFLVKDYSLTGKDEKLAQYVLPFTSIQEGYRHVHLRSLDNQPCVPASLFVHITIRDG